MVFKNSVRSYLSTDVQYNNASSLYTFEASASRARSPAGKYYHSTINKFTDGHIAEVHPPVVHKHHLHQH